MPDWTYQTIFRPALMRLGVERGRRLALGAIGRLGRVPGGRRVIQLMGHMGADPRLRVEAGGLSFPSRVGLGYRLDPASVATEAFAEFGFGFLEVGPIAAGRVAALASKLERGRPWHQPLLVRAEFDDVEDVRQLVERLASLAAGIVAPTEKLELVRQALAGAESSIALFAVLPAAAVGDARRKNCCERGFREGWLAGVVIEGEGEAPRQADLDGLKQLRETWGESPVIIAALPIDSPAAALDVLDAGADLVQVDNGMISAGPGLPKRINEALLYLQLERSTTVNPPSPADCHAVAGERRRAPTEAWFWACLMGLSMFLGGTLAMAIAATRIVLPYDESMAGLTRDELAAINPRLLPFMQHDRVTLAGTMFAVGLLYMSLAYWGVRRGVHWAYVTIAASAFAGFFSFFSFLGFGYFDPFHAFVTAVLFQFLLLMMAMHLPARSGIAPPGLHNDWRWRWNQWGQLLFVIQGVALLTAGIVISSIGMTSVFVMEDLEFMQTTVDELVGAHPRLIPLVAHDRATFGGMLIACGLATLLPALWGFARGERWLWWSLMLAGTFAYSATMQVHWAVGYHDPKHLLPAVGGLALLWAGGAASYAYLAGGDERLAAEWRRRLAAISSSSEKR